eukprot:TRINITY_DN32798_c0_g1_i1.p1 TRINITY_DN32798_c0_g1~~TRINITY_DN32798_c0_g1_i1.p1  ORF type:complete len:588 (-),score=71.35 TRINITY_DN32798_c0_g1_i1:96-1859(-)
MVRYGGQVTAWLPGKGAGVLHCDAVTKTHGVAPMLRLKEVLQSGLAVEELHVGTTISFELGEDGGRPVADAIRILKQPPGVTQGLASPAPSMSTAKGKAKGSSFIATAKSGTPTMDRPTVPASKGGGATKAAGAPGGKGNAAASTPSSSVTLKELSDATLENIQNAIGEVSAAPVVLHAYGEDGSPKVLLTLGVLNQLFDTLLLPPIDYSGLTVESPSSPSPAAAPAKGAGKAWSSPAVAPAKGAGKAAHQPVVHQGDIANEPIRGYDGEMVPEGSKWYTGKIIEFFPDEAYGLVDSPGFKAAFGADTPLYIHADHIDPEGSEEPIAGIDDEIIFHLVEDEQQDVWAWPPIIPKDRDFHGRIKTWNGEKGFVVCDVLAPMFSNDVYMHSHAAAYGGVDPYVGGTITFNLHVSEQGRPQTSSPRPLGLPAPSAPQNYIGAKGSAKGGVQAGVKRSFDDFSGKMEQFKQFAALMGHDVDTTMLEQMAKRFKGESSSQTKGKGKGEGAEWKKDDTWYEGTFKNYNKTNGFGFITCPVLHQQTGRDTYLHQSMLEPLGMTMVPIGDPVWFQVTYTPEGYPQVAAISLDGNV